VDKENSSYSALKSPDDQEGARPTSRPPFPSAPEDVPHLIARLGLVDEERLRGAWDAHLLFGVPFLEMVVELGVIDEDQLTSALQSYTYCRRCFEPAGRTVGLCEQCLAQSTNASQLASESHSDAPVADQTGLRQVNDERSRAIIFPDHFSVGLVVVADRRSYPGGELIPWAAGAHLEEPNAEMRQFEHYLSSGSGPHLPKARWWIASEAKGKLTIPATCDALLLIESWEFPDRGAPGSHIAALESQPPGALQGLIMGTSWKRTDANPSSLLSAAAGLSGLKALFLSSRKLQGQDWLPLAYMSHLEVLDLDESSMDDNGLSFVSKLAGLRYLNLSDTSVGDEGLRHLRGLSSSCRIIPNWRVTEGAWSSFR
jgi:hypothetical protein